MGEVLSPLLGKAVAECASDVCSHLCGKVVSNVAIQTDKVQSPNFNFLRRASYSHIFHTLYLKNMLILKNTRTNTFLVEVMKVSNIVAALKIMPWSGPYSCSGGKIFWVGIST